MRNYITLSILFLLFTLALSAQTNLEKKPVKLPDLAVASIRFIATTKNYDLKVYIVKVQLQIKNTGNADAPASILVGFINTTNGINGWQELGKTNTLPIIKAGGQIDQEFMFQVPFSLEREAGSAFRVKVDGTNGVKELEEKNNTTAGILIGL